jgi:hypothetical protein
LAAAYLLAGVAVALLAPFIGTATVPPEVFMAILLVWALGLIVLPVLAYEKARPVVLGSVAAVAAFLIAAIVVSGGLRSPFGY